MKTAWHVLFAFLLAIWPLAANAENPFAGIPDLRFDYYDIEGRTPAELYASMRARAPRDGDGVLGLGRTSWQIDVNWRERRRGPSCSVSDPVARLSIRILLPRLATTTGVTPEGLAFWRASRAGLEIHEAGHARIAWEHRDDFRKAAAKAGCRSIDRVAKTTRDKIVALQAAYDRETRHGQRQTPAMRP